ncbi:MAG: FHA domain-containing protein [Anaerolineae bacterium]
MSKKEPKKPQTADLRQTEYGKTWAASKDDAISEALSEILQDALENIDEHQPPDHGLLLYLATENKPLVITGVDVIRLGRNDEPDHDLTVDLNPFHGRDLGVSRHHAEITYNDGSYYIKDLGSTNGTWINGDKIPPYRQIPLQDSDQLRLGHLTMLVKFKL